MVEVDWRRSVVVQGRERAFLRKKEMMLWLSNQIDDELLKENAYQGKGV